MGVYWRTRMATQLGEHACGRAPVIHAASAEHSCRQTSADNDVQSKRSEHVREQRAWKTAGDRDARSSVFLRAEFPRVSVRADDGAIDEGALKKTAELAEFGSRRKSIESPVRLHIKARGSINDVSTRYPDLCRAREQ